MILSIIIHSAGLISLTFSLPMVGLMALTQTTKRTLANSSGFMFLFSGLIVFSVVLNFTITRAQKVAAGEPTDLGGAIFTGFIGSGIGLASGLIIFMGKWIVGLPYRDNNLPKSDIHIPLAGGVLAASGTQHTPRSMNYENSGSHTHTQGYRVPLVPQNNGHGLEQYYQQPYGFEGNANVNPQVYQPPYSRSPTKVAFMDSQANGSDYI